MYWRQSFDHTGLMQLLDAQSKQKFNRNLQENPPEFTIENVQSSFIDLSQNAEKMFEDGVVNVFRWLSNQYMTNDGFRIGDKVVMTWMVEPSFGAVCSYATVKAKTRSTTSTAYSRHSTASGM